MSLSGETSWRARKFGLQLLALYQLMLNLPSFQFAFGTLPSELREPAFAHFLPYHQASFTQCSALGTPEVYPALYKSGQAVSKYDQSLSFKKSKTD